VGGVVVRRGGGEAKSGRDKKRQRRFGYEARVPKST
jgi:hypothetical protein